MLQLGSVLLVAFLLGASLVGADYVNVYIEGVVINVNFTTNDGQELIAFGTDVNLDDGQLCSMYIDNVTSLLMQTREAREKSQVVIIRVNFIGLNGSVNDLITMESASEKNHKYLPYVADDLYHISYLGELSRIQNANEEYYSADIVTVNIEITESCNPVTFAHSKHSEMDQLQNILMSTVLLPLTTISETQQLCTFDRMDFRDTPLRLHSCCHSKPWQIGEFHFNIVCHNPEWMRSFLSNAVTLLMVKCLPHGRRFDSSPVAVEIERAKESHQKDEGADVEVMDADDLELMKNQKWVYLDVDPVHWLSSSIWKIINRTCLHSRRRCVIISLRFLAVFMCWSLDGLLMTITYVYYNSVFQYSFLWYQKSILKTIFKDTDSYDIYWVDYQQIFLLTSVYVPLAVSVLVMVFLSPIMMAKKRIAKILFWHQKCTVLGESFKCTIAN
ncbi:hypothetical protein CAPTEDRAFT_206275, partial [Capitella teleta]